MSYGPEGQREYMPPGPFQSTVSLNLDSVRDQKDACFADPCGLKANVLLSQDHRQDRAGGRKFVIDVSENFFRTKKGRFCAVISEPHHSPNGRLYGGAMVVVHPPTTHEEP